MEIYVNLFLISQNLGDFTSDKVVSEVVKYAAAVTGDKIKKNKALAILCSNLEENLKNIIYDAKSP